MGQRRSGYTSVQGTKGRRTRPSGAPGGSQTPAFPAGAVTHQAVSSLQPQASLCARAQAGEPRSALSPRSRRAGVSVSGANFRRSEVARRIGAMSGDSSGRRPEGRGRGRDPHRDRTRSRSRSRSPLCRRGAAPERREAPERPSLEDTEPSDSGDEMLDPATLEAETDHGLCRQIRHQYRALINSVQRKAAPGAARAGAASPPCARRVGKGVGRCGRRPGRRAFVCLHSLAPPVWSLVPRDLGGVGHAGPRSQAGAAGGQIWPATLPSAGRGRRLPSLALSRSPRGLAGPARLVPWSCQKCAFPAAPGPGGLCRGPCCLQSLTIAL